MARVMLDRWVPFRHEGPVVRCRVFCFPHAGGGAAFYRPLRLLMPPAIDFCPLELPGHAARIDERPLTSMAALMERLHDDLRPLMNVPFAFFGHSVGAWMAFEAARQLRSRDSRGAVHLFVSARRPPDRAPAAGSPPRRPSDHDLMDILHRFGGTPAAVLQCPDLMAALLPALRADLELADGYAVDPADRIRSPITVFGGAADDASTSLPSWRAFTGGKFRTAIFPGGHFYFSPAAEALAEQIIQDLHAFAGTPPADANL